MSSDILTPPKGAFGFRPEESQHHFLVTIPRGATGDIVISEHLTWSEEGSSPSHMGTVLDGQARVNLKRMRWDMIAEAVRAEFNQRLRREGKPAGVWKVGANPLRRDLGKELVMLAWAIEDADPGQIPNALAYWKGLVAEERWWLYTQTAAAFGHAINGRRKGWRAALQIALTETPATGTGDNVPEFYRIAESVSLFGNLEVPRNE
jgi:hypothetical protein